MDQNAKAPGAAHSTTSVEARSRGASKPSDVCVTAADLYFLPVETRVPLKFGNQTTTSVLCARVRVTVVSRDGREAQGWGETPLSVQWVWPSDLDYAVRLGAMEQFCRQLTDAWTHWGRYGHALEIGDAFVRHCLPNLLAKCNARRASDAQMPHLAALVCCSPFDIAIHDAFGNLVERPTYAAYTSEFMNCDVGEFFDDEPEYRDALSNKFPSDFFRTPPLFVLPAWHLVGGLDPLVAADLTGAEPRDGHPLLLDDWIARDGLKCLKIKLRGNDLAWDCQRTLNVGRIALEMGVEQLTTDFNCTVHEPSYVIDVLDKIQRDAPEIYDMILYVEQPFPYDLEAHPIDVREVSARKPLLMDESADSWRHVRMGKRLGWTGVALKTCKTQSGALLSLCWAQANNMHLMVQDLTNPMLAQIPHLLLAAHANTMHGVESNSMQFYPDASLPEARVHPAVYQRRNGMLDLASVRGPGFGYRIAEIERALPRVAVTTRHSHEAT